MFYNLEYTVVYTLHISVSYMSSSLTNLDQLPTSSISLWILFQFVFFGFDYVVFDWFVEAMMNAKDSNHCPYLQRSANIGDINSIL